MNFQPAEKYTPFPESSKPLPKFIGHHRILRVKDREILWTLGPHCIIFSLKFFFTISFKKGPVFSACSQS